MTKCWQMLMLHLQVDTEIRVLNNIENADWQMIKTEKSTRYKQEKPTACFCFTGVHISKMAHQGMAWEEWTFTERSH